MGTSLITTLIWLLFPIANIQQMTIFVSTGSMEPNLKMKDSLVVDQEYYSSHPVERFDIIVVNQEFEDFSPSNSKMRIVARVIGLPGEVVEIKKNKVMINGKLVKEPYKTLPCKVEEEGPLPCSNFASFKIPEGEFFLLGDNRGNSLDSRLWNPHSIKRAKIIGKVVKAASGR